MFSSLFIMFYFLETKMLAWVFCYNLSKIAQSLSLHTMWFSKDLLKILYSVLISECILLVPQNFLSQELNSPPPSNLLAAFMLLCRIPYMNLEPLPNSIKNYSYRTDIMTVLATQGRDANRLIMLQCNFKLSQNFCLFVY